MQCQFESSFSFFVFFGFLALFAKCLIQTRPLARRLESVTIACFGLMMTSLLQLINRLDWSWLSRLFIHKLDNYCFVWCNYLFDIINKDFTYIQITSCSKSTNITLNQVCFEALWTRVLSLIENKIQGLFQDFQEPFQVNSRIEALQNHWK